MRPPESIAIPANRLFPARRMLARLVLLACLLQSPGARADVLHLKNGSRVEGEVERVKGGYWVRKGKARLFFRDDQVTRWEKLPTLEDDYRALSARAALDDFDAQMALAAWCRKNNLQDHARWHYMIAVALRSDDARARRGAGFVRVGDTWLSVREDMERRGMRKYRGKWLPAAEATRLRLREEARRKRLAANAAAWRIIRRVAREDARAPLEPAVGELLALGEPAMFSLKRGASDGSVRARRLVLLVLGRMRTSASGELLVKRLRLEPRKDLTLLAARLLAAREDRDLVLRALLNLTVNHPYRAGRRRAWLGLRACADKRAIPALIAKVEYCPVPLASGDAAGGSADAGDGEPRAKAARPPDRKRKIEFNGREYVRGKPKDHRPYYPAHEALVHLTGELLPHKIYAWRNWWEKKHAEYRFPPLPE